jgi:hypothetical protein
MRTARDLLSLAVGPFIQKVEAVETEQDTCFEVFKVTLPIEEFRGLPPNWTAVILSPVAAADKRWSPTNIVAEAKVIVGKLRDETPVLMISDAKNVHFGDELGHGPSSIFSVDAPNLPARKDAPSDPRFSPFILALKRKGVRNLVGQSHFAPYIRGRPARGWQFYGRRKELNTLVNSTGNYMIIGSRRLGKTSLMQETERCLRAKKEEVYYINVQHCTKANEVAGLILHALSPRDKYYAERAGESLGERPLAIALKRLTITQRRTTLLIDELGNLIVKRPKDDWNFIGLLRNYTQTGNLRVIFSCFHEVLIKQQQESEGPLNNFANAMRLSVFAESEVEEFFLAPFDFWLNLQPAERKELRALVTSAVGFHPYFLQYFCSQLFDRMSQGKGGTLIENAQKLVRAELLQCFESPQEEVFYHAGHSALINYVFLSRCKEAEYSGKERLVNTIIDDDWLEAFLTREGFMSTLFSRRSILEGLELHGLSAPVDGVRSRQRIVTPIVYLYVKRAEQPLETYLTKLKNDIEREAASWGLTIINDNEKEHNAASS